ncbi:MAG: hypothetical protein COX79_02255 [Candidatus Levybacteria bacterium CG_4_10_14_0_2_um_filter_36_16]|nr:MAG: hypothetical protein AUK12_00770 [Candidatus Levybacteria bacterium CG2_30_37_29]PIZ97445.1 MAG: hypothetical protein COX79_02255 [Candidatus Levybacteria bacterium CG_4_10_14_0_2_um_filter_36_16]
MRIGIDISQIAYGKTGVANFLANLVEKLIEKDLKNHYVLFFSSLRRRVPSKISSIAREHTNVEVRRFTYPPFALDFLWNRLHILTIENFVGDVDIFLTSDWTEPPARNAKKATIIYDLIIYKHPEETHNKTEFNFKAFMVSPNIVDTQKRKLEWVKKESDIIFCISESTKKDIIEILGIDKNKIHIIYPGI